MTNLQPKVTLTADEMKALDLIISHAHSQGVHPDASMSFIDSIVSAVTSVASSVASAATDVANAVAPVVQAVAPVVQAVAPVAMAVAGEASSPQTRTEAMKHINEALMSVPGNLTLNDLIHIRNQANKR